MQLLPFIKMHGLGNDFVVIDDLTTQKLSPITPELARRLCDRRFGVGADQLLWLKPPQDPKHDSKLDILNSDGSTAEMCGNGIRAVALLLKTKQPRASYTFETLAGVKTVRVQGENFQVDMGAPKLGSETGEKIQISSRDLTFFEVNMGNPHAVFFVNPVAQFPVTELGPQIERHPRFPQRTNVEFVEILNPSALHVRVWERGAGTTLACGTGACAAAVAALATGRVKYPVEVRLPGGNLIIEWKGAGESVLMTGPAQEVFRGQFLCS